MSGTAMEREEAGAREERSGMQRRNGDTTFGKARFGGLGGTHPWQLEVVGDGWFLGDRELHMRERRTGKGGREGEGAKGPGLMDEGDVVVVEVAGGDGADEDAAAAHLKMMMGEGVLD